MTSGWHQCLEGVAFVKLGQDKTRWSRIGLLGQHSQSPDELFGHFLRIELVA